MRHGDVYFAAANGLAETRHVFLEGNNLPEAWLGRPVFTIGETGFGTGLNFLATWDLWRRTAPGSGRLHYLSVEGFPLTPADLERAHRPFPELASLARRLRALWPHPYAGFHRLHFDDDRITLTLLFGEAEDMLEALDARVDAWFLDGFSPAKNPDFWRPEVLSRIAELTRPGGTASSFTVAGAVRQGMESVGFHVEKAPGFGRKRHMLWARYGSGASAADGPFPTAPVPRTALVVGAGIAGTAAAHALARRHVDVILIDPDPDLREAASGNPAGIANPKPSADSSPAGRFHCAAFDYAERHIFRNCGDAFRACGVLELAAGTQARRRHEALSSGNVLPASALRSLSVREASQIAGLALPTPAIHFPRGGLLRPVRCAAWLRTGIQLRTGRILRLFPSDRGWTAELDGGETVSADIAVLACGMDAGRLVNAAMIPMTASRGQLSLVPSTPESARLATALSFGGYVSPVVEGRHVLGATYDDVPWPPAAQSLKPRQQDHRRNYRTLRETLPDFPMSPPGGGWKARVGFRCTTPDRLPLCGPVPVQHAEFCADSDLPTDREFHGSYKEGLFLYAGLGSRGLTTAPLSGELLASLVCHDPLPTEHVVTELLHPARFLIRALRKAGISAHF